MEIKTIYEGRRGCGYRRGGGLYLVSDLGLVTPCHRLPLVVGRCPTCGGGTKPARGWTWMDPRELFKDQPCRAKTKKECSSCPLRPGHEITPMGLLWIGEKYYKDPHEFREEGMKMGLSRRISQIPRNFVVGETWILLAHRRGKSDIRQGEIVELPAIFATWRPQRIEYVVKGTEPTKTLEDLEKRGITLVQVLRKEQKELFDGQAAVN